MKNVRRIAKWLMACMMTVFLAGVVSAAETTEKGEISSFNNYGENGVYEAIGEYEVAYGSVVADVTRKLPSTLTAKLTTGEEVEVPVTWVCVSDNHGWQYLCTKTFKMYLQSILLRPSWVMGIR